MKENDSPFDENKFVITHNLLNDLCSLSNTAGIKAVLSCITHRVYY
jgi:hypothetical protein